MNKPSPKRSKRRARLLRLAVVLMSVVFSIVVIELGCRVYLYFYSVDVIDGSEFWASCPPPFQGAPYFNEDFLKEAQACFKPVSAPEGANYLLFSDFEGEYFNIAESRRKTTDQPAGHTARILLFGGSTVFCHQVPDRYTIASYLQRLCNQRYGQIIKVENYGTPAMTAAQQTARLRSIPIGPNDIVMFFDGDNDIFYPLYNANVSGWLLDRGGHNGGPRKSAWFHQFLHPLAARLSGTSAIADVLLTICERQPPKHLATKDSRDRLLADMEEGYTNALLAARAYAMSHSGLFFHFLQPNLFITSRPLSEYEEELILKDVRRWPSVDTVFRLGYPRLRTAIASAGTSGLVSHDISNALDNRAAGQEVYLDFLHLNHEGNALVANAIFDKLTADGLLGEKLARLK